MSLTKSGRVVQRSDIRFKLLPPTLVPRRRNNLFNRTQLQQKFIGVERWSLWYISLSITLLIFKWHRLYPTLVSFFLYFNLPTWQGRFCIWAIFSAYMWYCRDKLHLMEIRSMCWAFWSLSCVLKERNDWKFKTLTSEGNFVIVSLSVVGEEIATGKTYIVCITVKSTQYLAFDFLSPEQCSWINFGSQQSGYCFYFPVR